MYRKAQSLPPSFVRRLGSTGDPFFSGVFEAGGFRIGFIRIPNYSLTNTTSRLRENFRLCAEISPILSGEVDRRPTQEVR
jgi:hypothetical protein